MPSSILDPDRRQAIAYFTDTEAFGGAERSLLQLLAELDRQRWIPTLLYLTAPGLDTFERAARKLNIAVEPLPRRHDAPLPLQAARFGQLVHRLCAQRATIFHANLPWPLAGKYGVLAAVAARIPTIVVTVHSCDIVPARRSVLLQRLIGTQIRAYIAVSHAVRNRLVSRLRVPARKIVVIHNSVPVQYETPPPSLARSAGRHTDRPVVLSFARLEAGKGLDVLLRAAAHLPEATFAIAGDGPERVLLEALARALGVDERVRFLGFRNDVADLLAACDVFVLPSLDEGFPLSVLEAMAACRPVVASKVGGVPEAITHDETGLLVPPGNPEALAAALARLLDDAPTRRRLAMSGWQSVNKQPHAAVQTMLLYERLTRGRQ